MSETTKAVEAPGIALRAVGLFGVSFNASYSAEEYWHKEVWLRSQSGAGLTFASDEYNLAPLFDVYVIDFAQSVRTPPKWSSFEAEFQVEAVELLWRDEWLEAGVPWPTVGRNAHMHCSGPMGSAPADAVAAAQVLAGLLLHDGKGRSIAIVTATSAPLNVDLVDEASAITALCAEHTVRPVNV